MTQELDLTNLRKIAEAATPGPWEMRNESPQMDGRNFTLRVHGKAGIRMSAHCYGFNGDPEFIATFNPETVHDLIDRLEQAEQTVERKQRALDTLARIIEMQQDAVILATDSQDLIGEDGDGDWDAAWDRVRELGEDKRNAEQAVERVHTLTNELSWSPNNVAIVQRYRDALDGEPNE